MKRKEPMFSTYTEEAYSDDSHMYQKEYTHEEMTELSHMEVNECRFTNVIFSESMTDTLYADVIFDHCDFSNINMEKCAFRRVRFENCKLLGTDLSLCNFLDTLFVHCNGRYANFNGTKWKTSEMSDCLLASAAFQMMECKNFVVQDSDLSDTEWYETKLAGLDFSTDQIEGISVRVEDIKGVSCNAEQAVAFAQLFGVIVK